MTDQSNGGISRITVASEPSVGYQKERTEIEHTFEVPISPEQAAQVVSEIRRLAQESAFTAAQQMSERVKAHDQAAQQATATQAQATATAAAQATPPAPTSAPQAPAQAPQQTAAQQAPQAAGQWATATKPNGNGTFRYIPSAVLPSDQFKALVAQAITDEGYDPNLFVIYDERTGKYGIEGGEQKYSPASVKPAEGSPYYGPMTKQGNNGPYQRYAFYVDFESDGSVSVTPTGDLKDANQALATGAATQQQAQPAAQPEQNSWPPAPGSPGHHGQF